MRPHSRLATARAVGLLLLCLAAGTGASAQAPSDKPIAQLLSEQKWPEALAAIDGLLKTRPNDTQLLMNRGAVLSNMNRNADALATFQKVASLNPQLPAAHNNMAVILAATGRYEEARNALERALKVQPNYATAYENLGDLFVHQANESYRRALQIDKSLKSAKTKLDMSTELIIVATGAPPAERAAPAGNAAPAAPATPTAPAASAPAAPTARPAAAAPATVAAVGAPAPPMPAATVAPPAAAEAGAAAQVEAAVKAWAQAWSRRDVAGFTAAYTPDFRGAAADAASWRADMGSRLRSRTKIVVRISELEVKVDGDRATASFQQNYESDQENSKRRTRKTLSFQRVQGQWLISEETRR